MMELLACLAVLLPCALAVPMVVLTTQARHLQTDVDTGKPMEHIFAAFKTVYNRQYGNDYEETTRRGIFEVNVQYIKDHNVRYAKGETSYFLGVNQFTDMTHEEVVKLYTGHIRTAGQPTTNASTYLSLANVLLPDKVDWRDKGYVTQVKNQGRCGSCWSFSATGSLEGQHFKKTGKLIPLSEQQLVDCSSAYGNKGCNGGLMDRAFQYIKAAGGIESESDYRYVAKEQPSCLFKKSLQRATVTGYTDISMGSEAQLQEAVANIGPVSVAIDASHQSFTHYAGGVYNEPGCSTSKLNHAVLVVGYGTDRSDYWMVKNSWGTLWGDSGYIKMTRNKNNQCGIATMASYPLV